MARVRTHYDNLKVSRDAPSKVIWAAHQVLVAEHATDAEILRIINKSYAVLSDPVKRAEHDLWIAKAEAQPTFTPPAFQQVKEHWLQEWMSDAGKWVRSNGYWAGAALVLVVLAVVVLIFGGKLSTRSAVTTSSPAVVAAPPSSVTPNTLLTDDPRAVLDSIPVSQSVKADAWNAYSLAASPADFKAKFDKIAIPDKAKADLWDMKFKAIDYDALAAKFGGKDAPPGSVATHGAHVGTVLPKLLPGSTQRQEDSRSEIDKVIQSGKYSELPPAEVLSQPTGSGPSHQSLVNQTIYTLTVTFYGSPERSVAIPAGQSTELDLAPGAYRVLGVAAGPVVPFVGHDNYLAGGEYKQTFFISP